jgi:hypothetical protein
MEMIHRRERTCECRGHHPLRGRDGARHVVETKNPAGHGARSRPGGAFGRDTTVMVVPTRAASTLAVFATSRDIFAGPRRLLATAPSSSRARSACKSNACRTQCATVGKACRVPFQLAYQTQRAGCTGVGRRLCIVAAKILYSAGRTLCLSVVTNCRRCCQGSGLCAATCGDGIVGENEDCDPPGWASCPDGVACGADCTCP